MSRRRISTLQADYLVYDMEMTGLNPDHDEIMELATIPMNGPTINKNLGFFVQLNPRTSISPGARDVHGISGNSHEFAGRPLLETVLPQFIEQSHGKILIGQSPRLDIEFIQEAGKKHAVMIPRFRVIDISRLFLFLFPDAKYYNLDEIAIKLGLHRREGHHNAFDDALLTAKAFSRMIGRLSYKDVRDISALSRVGRML